MKILLLNNRLSEFGGAERCLWDTARELRNRGWDVVLAGGAPSRTGAGAEGLRQIELDGEWLRGCPVPGPSAAKEVGARLAAERPDVVHLHVVGNGLAIESAERMAPTVCTVHDVVATCLDSVRLLRSSQAVCCDPIGLRCAVRVFTERCAPRRPDRFVRNWKSTRRYLAALRRVPAVVAPSEFMRRLLIKCGCDHSAVRTIHNFVRTPASPPLAPEPGVILFAGSVYWIKGLDLLLDALARVTIPWQLLVAGTGPDLTNIRESVGERGWQDRVHCCGFVPEEEMQSVYCRASIVVMPSRLPECLGMVGLEAMAHSRPVVAFDVGGIREWLSHDETGLLVRPNDISGMAAGIQRLLLDPGLGSRLGLAGHMRARQLFSPERHVDMLERTYHEAIGRSVPPLLGQHGSHTGRGAEWTS